MPALDSAAEWLAENDPSRGGRDHPYPYHSPKQLRMRRRREIPCGLIDTTAEHVRDVFRISAMRRPRLGEDV